MEYRWNGAIYRKRSNIYTFDPALQRKLDKYSKEYSNLCKLKEEAHEGSKTYEIKKTRVSIRLMAPCSEKRKEDIKKRIRTHGIKSANQINISIPND